MNGAESLVHTAAAAGVDVWFANPGTTEMPLVAALDRVPGVRSVLGLFEGVCTGAADGYGRMTDRPAATLLHLGPGFANGIANLHNARRARSPVVNVVGDHATWHLSFDAPLTSDIASLAAPVSGWLRSTQQAMDLASDMADAISAAGTSPGRVATLIAPADCQWGEAGGGRPSRAAPDTPDVDGARIDAVARDLKDADRVGILLGGAALREPGLRAAARVAAACRARAICETFPARLERGPGLPPLERLPYFPEQAAQSLANLDVLVLAGARSPVAFFAYDGIPSELADPESKVVALTSGDEDPVAALYALAEALGAAANPPAIAPTEPPGLPAGAALDPGTLGQTLAALQPEDAIVMDEGATSGLPYYLAAAAAPPHTFLTLTGGAIGQGLPCATGAAVACPDRKVIALQADGSGLYTLQALWTQARESLDVVTLICANRSYRILQIEMARAGIAEPGPTARSLTDLGNPEISWVDLARGCGVPALRAESCDELISALGRSFAEPGPSLIEVVL